MSKEDFYKQALRDCFAAMEYDWNRYPNTEEFMTQSDVLLKYEELRKELESEE